MLKRFLMAVAFASFALVATANEVSIAYDAALVAKTEAMEEKGAADDEFDRNDNLEMWLVAKRDTYASGTYERDYYGAYIIDMGWAVIAILEGPPGLDESYQDAVAKYNEGMDELTAGINATTSAEKIAHYNAAEALFYSARCTWSAMVGPMDELNDDAYLFYITPIQYS